MRRSRSEWEIILKTKFGKGSSQEEDLRIKGNPKKISDLFRKRSPTSTDSPERSTMNLKTCLIWIESSRSLVSNAIGITSIAIL